MASISAAQGTMLYAIFANATGDYVDGSSNRYDLQSVEGVFSPASDDGSEWIQCATQDEALTQLGVTYSPLAS
jgi:hypothetical protein